MSEVLHLSPFRLQLGERCSDHPGQEQFLSAFVFLDAILDLLFVCGFHLKNVPEPTTRLQPALLVGQFLSRQFARLNLPDQFVELLHSALE